jgi:hypothetical protein
MLRNSALLSRRLLLAGLGAGAAAAAAPALGLRLAGEVPGRRGRSFQPLQAAGLAEWSGAVGERFSVETVNGSHLLGIAAVAAFPGSGSRPAALGRSQAFSVAFELIAGPPLPAADRLYRLVHRTYPPLPIHMGAPSVLGRKTRLIAVFN